MLSAVNTLHICLFYVRRTCSHGSGCLFTYVCPFHLSHNLFFRYMFPFRPTRVMTSLILLLKRKIPRLSIHVSLERLSPELPTQSTMVVRQIVNALEPRPWPPYVGFPIRRVLSQA